VNGYGAKTRKLFVQLHHGEWTMQRSPGEARQIAASLVQAAEAAEQDACLIVWGKQTLGCDDGPATILVAEYRQWREQKRKELGGPNEVR
jgi:hypothetical protein